jgi:hypothetical protein
VRFALVAVVLAASLGTAGFETLRPCKVIQAELNLAPAAEVVFARSATGKTLSDAEMSQLAMQALAEYDSRHPWYSCLTDKR